MKVLHVITGLAPGGAENQLRLLLRHTRHEAEVVTLTNPGTIARAIRAEGTPVTHLRMGGNRDLRALGRLWRHMRRRKVDLVHVHLYRSCVYGRLAARLAGVPHVVTTEHSLGAGYIEGRATTAGVRLLYLATERLSDVTIAVSDAVRSRLMSWGVRERKLVTIRNGLDFGALAFDPDVRAVVRRSLGIPDDAFVIGALGRLDPVKRFEMLIDAAESVLGPRCRLLMVGDGPLRDSLRQRVSGANLTPYVVFAGERDDVAALLAAMDLLVSPSASETFGIAAIEGLGAGLPVLYAECPAIEELGDGAISTARRLDGGRDDLEEEIRGALRRSPVERLAPSVIVDRFSIESASRAVDELYDGLAV